MEIQLVQEVKQPELQRTQYDLDIAFTEKSTPSRADIILKFSKDNKKDKTLCVVRGTANKTGVANITTSLFVYDNAEALSESERPYVSKRNVLPEEPKPEEKAEEPAEEAAPEEKAEEAPAEPKAEEPAEEKKE